MISPQEPFAAGAETGEVAAAELTTVWSGSEAQLAASGEIRVVVLLRPRAEFHAVAPWAACVDYLGRLRDGTLEPGPTPFASQLADADQLQKALG